MPSPENAVQKRRELLGQELARHRQSVKMTQAAAATKLGWSRPKLIAMEAGKQAVTVDQLWALADLYGYDICSFFPANWYGKELPPRGFLLGFGPFPWETMRLSRAKQGKKGIAAEKCSLPPKLVDKRSRI